MLLFSFPGCAGRSLFSPPPALALVLSVTTADWFFLSCVALVVIGTVVLAARLLLLRPEALVVVPGLGASFLIGFAGPFLSDAWRFGLAATYLGLVIAISFAVGRLAQTRAAAALAGVVFVPLALIALGYGIYLAHATGWQGLRTLEESSDRPGMATVWFVFVFLAPVWLVAALLTGALAAWVNARKPQRPPPTPPAV